ncbi:hypothetical protein Ae201684P_002523 [Aphanomyces euteiches]|uniref:Receptor expression-enhancing protein n=1 Tax=Aphanomyces euteiches TaxID=100861 RepID=A0A6G0X508_9STRA|nr:hypothetical protein Ae201684_008465 [Aphanomyces euteiches]KAH9070153.1 hypothetical protein Ae201684P_002523 [Aphanomyces euteiches]KAH9140235.1 hypothetical protein AeRB84_015527 [Aphanomyces euteiches]
MSAMDLIEEWHADLRSRLDALHIPLLDSLEEQTGVDKVVLVVLTALIAYVVLVGGVGAGVLCNVVGFAYPGYASFRVLQKPAIVRPGEVRLWLMFWIVFACVKFVEVFADKLLSWIPSYNTFKLCAILALFTPSTRRTTTFYTRYLVPFLKPNESEIDKFVREAQFEADRVAAKAYNTDLFQGVMGLFKSKRE